MKLTRFNTDRLGLVEGEEVYDVTAALDGFVPTKWPPPLGDPLISNLDAVRQRIGKLKPTATRHALSQVKLSPAITTPTKLIGAPVNYKAHVDEANKDQSLLQGHVIKPITEWGLFLKANSALVGPHEGVAVRFLGQRTDHEMELAVVIGKAGTNIPAANAAAHIAGYAIGLDITLRGPQFQSFRKSMDTYAVFGPWFVTADEINDPTNLILELSVNGEPRQKASTANMVMDVNHLIELASSFYTLYPGDIIYTGTPDGVGRIVPGDRIACSIEGIGAMSVDVRAA